MCMSRRRDRNWAVVIALLSLFSVLLGCWRSGESPSSQAKPSAQERMPEMTAGALDNSKAEAIFREFVTVELLSTPGHEVEKARAAELVDQPPMPPSILRESARSYGERVLSILGSGEHATELILFGLLTDLQRSGECYSVQYTAMLTPGVAGCIDAESGRPLLVWITPEG